MQENETALGGLLCPEVWKAGAEEARYPPQSQAYPAYHGEIRLRQRGKQINHAALPFLDIKTTSHGMCPAMIWQNTVTWFYLAFYCTFSALHDILMPKEGIAHMLFGIDTLYIWVAVIILCVVVEVFTLDLSAIWFAVGGRCGAGRGEYVSGGNGTADHFCAVFRGAACAGPAILPPVS